uniref:Uncharacterized protein n=1 Tax=Anopheles maculatus TaxID=74869 RepID=A0A182TAN8_9DIPT
MIIIVILIAVASVAWRGMCDGTHAPFPPNNHRAFQFYLSSRTTNRFARSVKAVFAVAPDLRTNHSLNALFNVPCTSGPELGMCAVYFSRHQLVGSANMTRRGQMLLSSQDDEMLIIMKRWLRASKACFVCMRLTVRLNLIVWIGCCVCLLLQAPWVVAAGHDPPPGNRPIQLEDIERDNLNSERQVFKKEAIAQQQQQEQQQHGASSTQSNNHYTVQIQHHPGSAAGTPSSVKYVTPLPAPTQTLTYAKDHAGPQQQYISIPQQPTHHQHQQVPQVHEDHSTYTVPSRQSLLQPVIGGGAPASPYLTPQPQYVYVQARPQQLPQQYAGDNNLPQSLLHILPQNSQ